MDIDDEKIEMELAVGGSPPLAEIEEKEEEEDEEDDDDDDDENADEDDLLDYDDDDDDDDEESMMSGDYTEDESMPPEIIGRSASAGFEDMNNLGLSELSDVGEDEEFDVTEEEEEKTTKCCGKGTMRKIRGALIGFLKAAATVIYKVYAMMTPKQKMVIAGAATAAVMSMVGIEREEAVTEGDDDYEADVETVADGEEGEDEMTTTDVIKDVASDFIHVIIDNIDKTE